MHLAIKNLFHFDETSVLIVRVAKLIFCFLLLSSFWSQLAIKVSFYSQISY